MFFLDRHHPKCTNLAPVDPMTDDEINLSDRRSSTFLTQACPLTDRVMRERLVDSYLADLPDFNESIINM